MIPFLPSFGADPWWISFTLINYPLLSSRLFGAPVTNVHCLCQIACLVRSAASRARTTPRGTVCCQRDVNGKLDWTAQTCCTSIRVCSSDDSAQMEFLETLLWHDVMHIPSFGWTDDASNSHWTPARFPYFRTFSLSFTRVFGDVSDTAISLISHGSWSALLVSSVLPARLTNSVGPSSDDHFSLIP